MTRYATVRVAGELYGVDVAEVLELQSGVTLTRLPLAAPAVAGLMNLRGRIVTVLDLRRCLGVAPRPAGEPPVNLVLGAADNPLGLLADQAGDVIAVDERERVPRPAHARGPGHELIAGVFALEGGLLRALDVGRVRACAAPQDRGHPQGG
jgi:purine-binding chemotaxis protein CheW